MISTTRQIFLRNCFPAFGVFLLLCSVTPSIFAQTFSSGSTGALGAFNPTVNTEVVLPDDGVLNYTTINIPANITITFKRNTRNTPVVMLASGDVTIAGTINISGAEYNSPNTVNAGLSGRTSGGLGGAGGFNGGGGGSVIDRLRDGNSGDGPGGGGGGKTSADGQTNSPGGGGGFFAKGGNGNGGFAPGGGGNRYGSLRILPLTGGSGGGGSSATTATAGYGGGGGGGALLIASSGKILFQPGNININANGGRGVPVNGSFASGGGAGGAIKLMATTIAGNPTLQVSGGQGFSVNNSLFNSGSPGYVRVEAINYENYNPSIQPNLTVFSAGLPTTVTPANLPQLRITTVAGTNAPATPKGSFFQAPDVILPASQTSAVAVGLAGTNIPTGTIVKVTVTGETGAPVTIDSAALAGTSASSTATASVNLSPGYNLINAIVSVDVQLLAQNNRPMYIEGERIKRVEVAASSNGNSVLTFITETGKRIKGE